MISSRLYGLQAALLGSLVGVTSLPAALLYWDTNGTTAGSGNAAGTWDTGTTLNWTETEDGTAATRAWADGDSAVFSAGTDGVAAVAVTVSGTVKTPSIALDDIGLVRLTGGTIDITGGAVFDTSILANTTARSLAWSSAITGAGNLEIRGHGDTSDTGGGSNTIFSLTGANTFTGDVKITSGVVHVDSVLGAASNKVILNGGAIVDPNLNRNFTRTIRVDDGFTGVYRTYGSVATGQISGAILGAGTLKHTDGGTLTVSGDGSAFTGTYNNARGNTNFTTANWAGTHFVNSDTANAGIRFNAAGETTIKSYEGDRDLFINGGRLNITSGSINVVSGAGLNNFWIQTASTDPNQGVLTSSSGTLTLDWGSDSYVATGATDRAIRVKIEDYNATTPLALVKNSPGGVARFDKANTYTGGTTINGGRISVANVQALGTGAVTVIADPGSLIGGQAYLTVAGTYANNFTISGIGAQETVGVLGAIRYENNVITSGTINVASDARIVCYSTATGTHSGALTGSANLEFGINGNTGVNGTLNLNGNAAGYTGKLTVARGRLNLNSPTLGGSLEVKASGIIGGENAVAGNTLMEDGSMLVADGATSGALATTGNLTLTGTVSVSLNNAAAGPNLVATYGGTLTGDASNLALAGGLTGFRPGGGFDTTTTPGSVIYNQVAADLIWTGVASPDWDTAAQNWLNGAAADQFYTADRVSFTDAGSAVTMVNLVGSVGPSLVTVNSSAGTADYTFSGSSGNSIVGGASLLKSGTSTLTINAPNAYTGGTTIRSGTVQIATADSLGTGNVALGDSGTGNDSVALYLDSQRVNFARRVTVAATGTGTSTLGSRATVTGAADNNQFTSIVLQRDVIFDSSANDRTDYENISGTGSITVTGTGRTIILGTNSFTGNVVVEPTEGGSFQTGVATTGNQNYIPDASSLTIRNTNNGTIPEYRLSSAGETVGGLNGDGNISLNSIAGTLTVGGANSSGDFSGVMANSGTFLFSLTKTGTGTQILSGPNTYTGNTVVNAGTLQLASTGELRFAPANTASNQVNGAGTAVFDGAFVIAPNAITVTTGTWTLVTVGTLTESFGPTFSVKAADGTPWANTAGVWSRVDVSGLWKFTQATGVLTLEPATTFASWMAGFTFPSGADTTAAGDPDSDGVPNLIENVFGTSPVAATAGLTLVSGGSGSLVVKHPVNATPASNVSYRYEWSTDLTEWKTTGLANAGGTTAVIGAVTAAGEATVTATLSGTPVSKVFLRIAASIP